MLLDPGIIVKILTLASTTGLGKRLDDRLIAQDLCKNTPKRRISSIKWLCSRRACDENCRSYLLGPGSSSQPLYHITSPLLPRVSAMDPTPRRPKRRDHNFSALTAAIEALDIAKESPSPKPATAVFGTVSTLLTTIRVSFLSTRVFRPLAYVLRIRRPTKPIMPDWGWPAPMYAQLSTEG